MILKPKIQNSQTTYSQGGTKESNKGSLNRRSCILRHRLKRIAGMHNRTVWHRMRRDAGYMGQRGIDGNNQGSEKSVRQVTHEKSDLKLDQRYFSKSEL